MMSAQHLKIPSTGQYLTDATCHNNSELFSNSNPSCLNRMNTKRRSRQLYLRGILRSKMKNSSSIFWCCYILFSLFYALINFFYLFSPGECLRWLGKRVPPLLFITRTVCVYFLCSNMSSAYAEAYGRASGHPPRVVDSDVNTQSVFAGHSTTILCSVTGNPPPEISWLKDGELIGADWSRYQQKRSGLRIRKTKLADSGMYICHAVNGFGTSEIKTLLTVRDARPRGRSRKRTAEKPTFSQPVKMRQNIYIKPQGGAVSLRCKAKGKPKPRIRWYKDGNLTMLGQSDPSVLSTWTLHLRDIRVEDSGHYRCRVWNSAGEIFYEYTLRVVGNTGHERPVIVKPHPVNTTVKAGEKASLQCKVRSIVSPTVKWIKRLEKKSVESLNGKWPNNSLKIDENLYLILPPQQTQMMRLKDGSFLSKLVIDDAGVEDSGMYICLGANTLGYNFRYAYLTVLSDGRSESETREALPSLPLGVIVSLPIFALVVVGFVATKCFCNHWSISGRAKPPLNPANSPTHYDEAERLRPPVVEPRVDRGSVQVLRSGTTRTIYFNAREDYVNPTHAETPCASESSGRSKSNQRFPGSYPLSDVIESDVASGFVAPPPPPPSQLSQSSSYESSSRHSRSHRSCRRSHSHHHHSHHHKHRSRSSSSHSHTYRDY